METQSARPPASRWIGVVSLVWMGALAGGCPSTQPADVAEGGRATASAPGAGGIGGAPSSGSGGLLSLDDADAGGAADATDGSITHPCGSACGPIEQCDSAHLGYDDDCDGLVDEGCPCSPGAVHWCFRGDRSYRHAPGCFDGTETCSELGTWGPCTGGVQAVPPDNCFLNDTSACHAITTPPYAVTDLKAGTGTFSVNATPGTETYTVQCPTGVSQCPGVTPPESFQAIQSGEYTVTYTKHVAGDVLSCTFSLFVGAPGLRVELSWEHYLTDRGTDLDLHVHQPLNTDPWAFSPGAPQDCNLWSCKYDKISKGGSPAPHWFPDGNVIPMPVNWDLQPVAADNTCYDDLHGVGAEWAGLGMGCHNPRLDIDEIQCDLSVTDPYDANFCAPENVNVDYPPDGQWLRVAVHYWWNHAHGYAVHPEIKVFCNGALSADLGPEGYYATAADAGSDAGAHPVTFYASDGAGIGQGNMFWIVADVAFTTDRCGATSCVVQPIYADAAARSALLTTDMLAAASFAPPWPAPPSADAGP